MNMQVPLVKKCEHIYLEWPKQNVVLFNMQKFIRPHRAFSHPSNDKLVNFLRLARLSKINSKTSLVLDDVVKQCKNYEHYGPSLIRLKTAIHSEESLGFGDKGFVVLIFPCKKAVLHLVDIVHRFFATSFRMLTEVAKVSIQRMCRSLW